MKRRGPGPGLATARVLCVCLSTAPAGWKGLLEPRGNAPFLCVPAPGYFTAATVLSLSYLSIARSRLLRWRSGRIGSDRLNSVVCWVFLVGAAGFEPATPAV
jgi:hypothetical protein